MRRIAVTGGAGFIGSNLTRRLISEGYSVVVVDDLSTGHESNIRNLNCEFIRISITDVDDLKKAIWDCDTIFHLGARGSVPRSLKDPVATHEVNVNGTLNVLEIARETGAHVVFSSSSSVYGSNLQLPKDEKMWVGPLTPYAASKLAGEGYVQSYSASYNFPCTLFRFFNVFGPGQRPDHEYAAVLPKWIWLAMQKRPIEVFGDGTASRDFTYIDSIIDVLVHSIQNRVIWEGPINLAFGNRISLKDVIALLQNRFPSLEVKYSAERKGDIKDSQNRPNLLNQIFPEIKPKAFEIALEETINWLEKYERVVSNNHKPLESLS